MSESPDSTLKLQLEVLHSTIASIQLQLSAMEGMLALLRTQVSDEETEAPPVFQAESGEAGPGEDEEDDQPDYLGGD